MTNPDTDRTPAPTGRPVGDAFGQGRDEHPAAIAAMLPPGNRAPRQPTCQHCGTVATVSWQRTATDAERDGYWAAIEANIRSQPNLFNAQNAEYTADRTQPVTKAVFGCDDHQVDDMAAVHAADCGGHGACQCEGTTTNG